MKLELAQSLVSYMVDSGDYDEDKVYVYHNYQPSYDKETTGIVVPKIELIMQYCVMYAVDLVKDNGGLDNYDFYDIDNLRFNSLGKSVIVY